MKSEDEIQRQLAYWSDVVAVYRRGSIQGHKVSNDKLDKVTEARFRIQDLIWVLGEGEGGKASKSFSVSTDVLLELFGDADAGNGKTYVDKYNASFDRNSRYGIRKKLLEEVVREIGGYIS